jgi:hypothetical protein
MKVKLFYINDPMSGKGQNAAAFESQINFWLAQNPTIQIERIEQSSSAGSMGASLWLISIWYK